ncbi:MAG: hypothetical protein Ct9H300mP3_02670 [Gammaproteobacteria bacterium]|nr:MAG: hypothetical protein Ct9H300mP3_02670 [Gammaproteobacteria bacterium]
MGVLKSLNGVEEIGLGKRVGNVVARQMISFLTKKGKKTPIIYPWKYWNRRLVVNYATC